MYQYSGRCEGESEGGEMRGACGKGSEEGGGVVHGGDQRR